METGSSQKKTSRLVLTAEEGTSFWQPKPANGYVTVKASPWTVPSLPFSQGIQVIPSGSHVRSHTHETQIEVIYCLEGEGTAEIDGIAYPMVANAVFTLLPGMEHSFINSGDRTLKFIWTIATPGLENFFKTIGKPRSAEETPPPPFDRPSAKGTELTDF